MNQTVNQKLRRISYFFIALLIFCQKEVELGNAKFQNIPTGKNWILVLPAVIDDVILVCFA
ncbi:hypothetical protein [Leptospira jelokensis]|uniref:Uncharacterized protein n=1 Tax=Leptospira jelokensis TaxID=2484931 RepID=A0A4Z0ZV92_9LEPT|nr:hypothetical protein [Leptospira jelokensis]TGL72460.1 hypothetical protein EHQ62_06510 [Leptospira jelokensis]